LRDLQYPGKQGTDKKMRIRNTNAQQIKKKENYKIETVEISQIQITQQKTSSQVVKQLVESERQSLAPSFGVGEHPQNKSLFLPQSIKAKNLANSQRSQFSDAGIFLHTTDLNVNKVIN